LSEAKKTADQTKTVIKVKLLPKSSSNQVVGCEGGLFRVKVTAPPIEGKANKALVALLAGKLRIPKGAIQIIAGKSSRLKSIRIDGLSEEEINRALEE
jgi:uncharacterized protein (TIGR00251 family)